MIELHYSYTIDYDYKTVFLNIYTEDRIVVHSYTILKTIELTPETLAIYKERFLLELAYDK